MNIPFRIQSQVWRWHNRRVDEEIVATVCSQTWWLVDRQLSNQFHDQVYDQLRQEVDTW